MRRIPAAHGQRQPAAGAGAGCPSVHLTRFVSPAEASRRAAKAGERPAPGWLQRARALVDVHFAKPLPLVEVARQVGVHPVHLARTFRRVHQMTFAGYVRHVRIEFARRELAVSGAPLGDIAVAAGFCDQSHFSRLFKRYTGQTPAEYRLTFQTR